jgi:hypothetical protein
VKYVFGLIALFGLAIFWMLNGEPKHNDSLIAHLPVTGAGDLAHNPPGVPVAFDADVSSDGNGSLRIDAREPTFVNLYQVWPEQDVDLSFRQLVYEAKVRTEDAQGDVFLVMQAEITSGPGAMPVVGRERAIQGTRDWTTLEIAAGNPGGTHLMGSTLQLHVDGPGTVWIDDIRLINRQLH